MISRFKIPLILALLLSLWMVTHVSAGGWAVITLDELPTHVVAGEPLKIGFAVLQHGRTPMTNLSPTITANLHKDAEFVVYAEPEGEPGHYTATLNFPTEGAWNWSIQTFFMDQPLPILNVAAATGTTVSEANTPVTEAELALPAISPMVWMGALALVGGLVSALIAIRNRKRQAVALTVVSLLAGVTLFLVGASEASAVEAQPDSVPDAVKESSLSQVEYGRQLFIAKGCITCHYNSKAASLSEYRTIEMGAPNLSNFSADPEIIFMRLKDPASVKSDTQMPQLNLKEREIEALIAFLNSDPN